MFKIQERILNKTEHIKQANKLKFTYVSSLLLIIEQQGRETLVTCFKAKLLLNFVELRSKSLVLYIL